MNTSSQARMEAARGKLPLRRVIEQSGKAPQNDNWKAFPKCPFCDHGGAGVFTSNVHGVELFKCHHIPCPSGNEALDEVGFMALDRGLTRSAAYEIYLREAGEWHEERLAPSVLPGSSRRRPEPVAEGDGEHEGLISECAACLRAEGKASISLLQRRMHLGYSRAEGIMAILEKRGVVGPARPGEAREILPEKAEMGKAESRNGTDGTEGTDDGSPLRGSPDARPPEGGTPTPDDDLPDAELDAIADTSASGSGLETAEGVESAALPGASGVPDTLVSTETSASGSPLAGGSALLPTADSRKQKAETGTNGTEGAEAARLDKLFGDSAPPPPPPPPPPPGGGGADEEEEPPTKALEALRWFYEHTPLMDCDVELLWRKRGLTRETALALGYRSNCKANKAMMLQMLELFPPMVLLESGLFKYPSRKDGDGEDSGKTLVPNAQFYGMALVPKRDPVTGKKVRDEDDSPVVEPVWGDPDCPQCREQWGCLEHPGPILIPYFNTKGELIHLRPHKGMMKDKSPRFYVARPSKAYLAAHPTAAVRAVAVGAVPGITMAKLLLPDIEEWLEDRTANVAVVTEGEFKAGALWQELDALPQGTMVRQVVVVYDNEDKRDPDLPSYQEEEWKQLEVETWSRFLAGLLEKQGFDSLVGHLPDSWRDAKGKADWDGRLAARMQSESRKQKAESGNGPDARPPEGGTPTPEEIWAAVHPSTRAEFMEVLRLAVPFRQLWQSGGYDSKQNRIIESRLERLNYERLLPVGGEDEATIVRRLRRMIPRLRRNSSLPPKSIGYLNLVAQKYEQTKGGYYIFKKLTDKERDKWTQHLGEASGNSDTDLKRMCELVLFAGPDRTGGLPMRVSDFYVKAHYCLVKTSGARLRLVSLHNIHGISTGVVRLPSEEFAQPAKFRVWLLDTISGGTWRAGERELQAMQEDMGRDLARREISEVSVRGYHAESGCWFYGDSVYLPDGSHVKADREGVIAIKSAGAATRLYTLAPKDHENQDFCQGTPLMHPHVAVTPEDLKAFFGDVVSAFYNTQGTYAGVLAMGTMIACFAGPEIYKEWNGVPSLWVHGQAREGKSCFVRWLFRILGFYLEKGMPLLDSTKAGLGIALQQYGEGMIWMEEFQPGAPSWLIEKLKNIHDRGTGIKKTYDDEDRRIIRSMAVVTGIATSTNGQLKSRYVHVQVAKTARKEQTFDWFQKHSHRFYQFGRFALEHRAAFAARTVELTRAFLEDADIKGVDERSRLVHGSSWAAFVAFNELLGGVMGETAITDFRRFTIAHAQESEREVNKHMNIAEFWQDVMNAHAAQKFGETPGERRRIWKFVEDTRAKCPVSEYQMKLGAEHGDPYRWVSGLLYFKASVVLDIIRKHRRERGDDRPLDQADLWNHMKVQPYLVPSPYSGGHTMRFGDGSRVKESCWCIRLDLHPWGYRPQTDEEFFKSLHPEDGPNAGREDIWIPREEWSDGRKGELFKLVESLKNQKGSGEDTAP